MPQKDHVPFVLKNIPRMNIDFMVKGLSKRLMRAQKNARKSNGFYCSNRKKKNLF